MDEKTFLESLAATYTTADRPQDAAIRSMALRTFMPHFEPESHALELGCDAGYMTRLLAPHFRSLTVVDGSSIFLDRDITAAGLFSLHSGGLMLKPFADFQLNAMHASGLLGAPQLEGLYQLGLEYPDLAGSLFSVCRVAA